jgi:uncharacterized DUF497 family protein
MLIEFDPAKNDAHLDKHGIALADAGLVIFCSGQTHLVSAAADASRLMDVAWVAEADTVLVLVYVERGDAVRAISLRRASRQERKLYEARQKN